MQSSVRFPARTLIIPAQNPGELIEALELAELRGLTGPSDIGKIPVNVPVK
jgi:hypothetical protein